MAPGNVGPLFGLESFPDAVGVPAWRLCGGPEKPGDGLGRPNKGILRFLNRNRSNIFPLVAEGV